MRIPSTDRKKFVREIANECLISQQDRIQRGAFFKNYAQLGAEDNSRTAMYNKTFAYLDDLESLLYSPISLRFHIGDPDLPNVLQEAKGRAAATKLRNLARQSETDTMISAGVYWSLVKGKSFIKQNWKRGKFAPKLVQPEAIGVLYENHGALDEDMEAFVHTELITPYQFNRMIWDRPDRKELMKFAQNYVRSGGAQLGETQAEKQVVIGGLYPFQPSGGGSNSNTTRGLVDWMSGPTPQLSASTFASLMRLDEVWIWDDKSADWVTFQMIGDEILLMGHLHEYNAFAYNPASGLEIPELKGQHPFTEFCPNPIDGYFWGRSEIVNVAMLQEALNSRLNGINGLLRRQEDPSIKATGTSVNQNALTKFKRPGGHWSDMSANAKLEREVVQIPADLWGSLHEYERMFDDMGGLPPIARGHGESGVRSGAHADTLVRMFSPRFKDRALLIERSVEALGGTMLDLAKVHVDKKLSAWVPEKMAGPEKAEPNPLIVSPIPGEVQVIFRFADLDEDATLTVDAHSSSPAFAMEAKALIFDLYKIGSASAEQVVEHVDAPDPEGLIAGVERREAQKAEQIAELTRQGQEAEALKLIKGGRKR